MIKTTIDTTKLEGVAVEYYNNVLTLAQQLQEVGFSTLEIIKGDTSWCDYELLLTVEGVTFKVRRDYKNIFNLSLHPYRYYNNVSHSKRGEVYKNTFISNSVKVITKKKVDNAIKEELAYHECMTTLNDESLDKIQHYLSTIKALENDYTVSYNHKMDTVRNDVTNEWDYIRKEVTGGYIIKNGVRFSFELDYSSGYIKEQVSLEYSYDENKIDMFKLLADNKYTK